MSEMGNLWKEEGLENYGIFQAMDIGITLVVSFKWLTLMLGSIYYGRRRREEDR